MDLSERLFQKVLVGVDGSEDALQAAKCAIKIVKATGGHVTFLFVATEEFLRKQYERKKKEGVKGGSMATALVEQARSEEMGRKVLADVAEFANHQLGTDDFSTKLRSGDPRAEFVEELRSGSYDLCVIGRHGASKSFTTVFGKLSEAIFRETDVPILILKGSPECSCDPKP
ncbi:MAG: hypothetical protein Kow0069_20540 [Promethearchaeota archaeon]